MKKILLMIMLVSGLFAWDTAKVKYVIDGDTLMLQKGNAKPFKVRLIAIDAFETKFNHRVFKQLETLKNIHPNNPNHKKKYTHTVKKVIALGLKASDYVENKYLNKTIKYHSYGKDKYGRELVWIQVLTFSLVRQGWAIYYPNNQIHKDRKAHLLKLSRDANINHRGIYKRF
ncbi:MAG: thermonuclease family protein [Sulfurospirillum sp.]|nr:thermonuclease family protein [Sulfurospirillum sp.]